MSDSYHHDVAAMPAVLRALLEAELAAGNQIAEVGHSFPAPPAGAYFKLTRPLLTRAQNSGDGIDYYDRKNSIYSGEITDAMRFYFLLEPPHPPEPEPDMAAIRAALAPKAEPVRCTPSSVASARVTGSFSAVAAETTARRFEKSMIMNYDKWHDGIGYDLDALRAMSPTEKKTMEAKLIARVGHDWRDIEALACLDTPTARAAIAAQIGNPSAEIRNAVIRYAPGVIPDSTRTISLVQGLEQAKFFHGLSQTLDQVAEFHPPLVVDALLRGALVRAGEIAVHFAAMLYFIHDQAPEPFDMEQRPFFLRFNTENRTERATVFRELCDKIGVDAARYLPKAGR